MGLRYRKSVNVGLGFRINFSKSGVGYSWGGKGFRFTKTATGRNRTTLSIPGTGISWVQESGGKQTSKRNNTQRNTVLSSKPVQLNNNVSVNQGHFIENADVSAFEPAEFKDFLNAINHYYAVMKVITVLFFPIFAVFFFAMYSQIILIEIVSFLSVLVFSIIMIRQKTHKINAGYELDEYGEKRVRLITSLVEAMKGNAKIWQVNSIYDKDAKDRSGAAHSINRSIIQIQEKQPLFLRTNVPCYLIKLKNEQIYILPDKLLIEKNMRVGALDWKDIEITVDDTVVIEDSVQKDAEVISETWRYVNKDGSRDKRFKGNYRRYRCRYGVLKFESEQGFNTVLYISNVNKAKEFLNILRNNKN